MNILLNIGLAPSAVFGGPPLHADSVLDILTTAGFVVLKHRLSRSETEDTVAVRATAPSWCRDFQHIQSAIYSVSMVLRQEAIAWCEDRPVRRDRTGWLTGPHALAWGSFSYEHFILP